MVANTQAAIEGRWDDVRLFLALYRRPTLAAAAALVGLDASTLSRRLVALEEALGSALFDRTRDGLVPTDAAELLLPAAEEMAAAHARFARQATGFERVTEGTVRISVPPGIAESFIAPALLRLRAKHPGLRIALDASIGFVDLTRREADLAVRSRRPQTGDLVSVKLSRQKWLPLVARAQAKPHAFLHNWADLTWIGWGDDLASFPPQRWLEKHVPRSCIALSTSHFSAQVVAVEAGLGAALLPQRYLHQKTLRRVRYSPELEASVQEIPSTEPWLVGHRALRGVPRVAAVWDFLVEEFARLERDERRVAPERAR